MYNNFVFFRRWEMQNFDNNIATIGVRIFSPRMNYYVKYVVIIEDFIRAVD